MTDDLLEKKITDLQNKIITWAKKNNLWKEFGVFRTYFEHFQDEPSETTACITVLEIDSNFYEAMYGEYGWQLRNEFDLLVDGTEFWYEFYTHSTLVFYCNEEELNKLYLDYFEWQWISNIIKPDYTNLYQEVFEYFNLNPKKLYSLTPRKLEILISEIFKNQGFHTILGPGNNDGGVDLRIYQKDEIDQIVTLVQIKKYKESLPIKLESVAYLQAIVDEEKANRGLFITTSKYLPQAKKFASRQNKKLILSDSADISRWCDVVKTRIVRDKSLAITDESILNILKDENGLIGKIVVASIGYNCIENDFCIILKDTPYVSLLMRVPAKNVKSYDPPYNFQGAEIPLLDETILKYKNKENIFRASKSISKSGRISFAGQKKYYTLWDGKPRYFDLLD
jgi:hypothetical protein